MNFSRFHAPLNPQEHDLCAGCEQKLHYTALDELGYCQSCRKEKLCDEMKEEGKDRRLGNE